jgi:hypothetical protein
MYLSCLGLGTAITRVGAAWLMEPRTVRLLALSGQGMAQGHTCLCGRQGLSGGGVECREPLRLDLLGACQ